MSLVRACLGYLIIYTEKKWTQNFNVCDAVPETPHSPLEHRIHIEQWTINSHSTKAVQCTMNKGPSMHNEQ
jgi:hypothetical protein